MSTGMGANIFSLYRSFMNCFTGKIKAIDTIEIINVAKLVLDMLENILTNSFNEN